ncbi:hypothetical protein [Polynucleobacter sp.]|jgi:hypothetical protein|uniref:hypothetical protein n=1 Tax=Polynucleobacter sp. TaxID=2029855 RepID=UPI002735F51E|nr:hypothetical protein [Polynucleobacter sp.]MDP3121587.1 hypothetical protein [Polynucleobacter sp.]
MFKFFDRNQSDFVVKDIDRRRRVVVVEDPALGLECEVPFEKDDLLTAEISGAYTIKLSYIDGKTEIVRFLK